VTLQAADRQRIAGLDGLRGVAVLLVLAFHLWPSRLPAGFVGVTLFFTLSGFLITGILLDELERTGTLSLRSFWSRRFRRLVPVSLTVLTLVTVIWTAAGWMTAGVRRDLIFSLFQAANWGHVLAAQRYSAGVDASPVLHYWSLAIEEQLYLVLPLLLLWMRSRRRASLALSALLGVSIVAIASTAAHASTSYYSTFSRMGELLVGALAAATIGRRARERRLPTGASITACVGGLGFLVWVALRVELDDPAVTHGLLLGCAIAAVVTIVAVASSPALGRAIDVRPLAWIGTVSYAVYVVHWPVLQALRHTSIDPGWVPWLTLAATLLIAAASNRWFETPIRAQTIRGRMVVAGGGIALVVILVGATMLPLQVAEANFEAAQRRVDQLLSSTTQPREAPPKRDVPTAASPAPGGPTATSSPPRPPRITFFGDSKALALELGIGQHPASELAFERGFTPLGCPLGRTGRSRLSAGAASTPLLPECDWTRSVPDIMADWTAPVDAAFVWFGTWDVVDRRVPAIGNRWTSIDDATYRTWLLSEMAAFTDSLTAAHVARVVWLTVPVTAQAPDSGRLHRWNEMLHELVTIRPTVEVIDVATWIEASADAHRLLPDGVHLTWGDPDPNNNTAAELAAACLLPVLSSDAGGREHLCVGGSTP
jgi:peptidoglycan/LPS O-acetylase OafA/YrhL